MRSPFLRRVVAIVIAASALGSAAPTLAQEIYQRAPILTVLPKDAIPAIDRPEFVSVAEADTVMQADELVISVPEGKSARGYSTWLLNHHEIVNDVVDGVPLAVTW
jgi:hypothetical protein